MAAQSTSHSEYLDKIYRICGFLLGKKKKNVFVITEKLSVRIKNTFLVDTQEDLDHVHPKKNLPEMLLNNEEH